MKYIDLGKEDLHDEKVVVSQNVIFDILEILMSIENSTMHN